MTSGSASRSSGSTSATGASRSSRPSSTSCMTTVAVHTFEIDPIWNSESGRRLRRRSPCSARRRRPRPARRRRPGRTRRMPSVAPGTLCRSASAASRRCQCSASMRGRRGPAASPAYCSTQSTTAPVEVDPVRRLSLEDEQVRRVRVEHKAGWHAALAQCRVPLLGLPDRAAHVGGAVHDQGRRAHPVDLRERRHQLVRLAVGPRTAAESSYSLRKCPASDVPAMLARSLTTPPATAAANRSSRLVR